MDGMDARLLDVIIGVAGFVILAILLAALPLVMSAGPAYLLAIIVFVLFLAFAGYKVNEQIT